MNKGVLMMRTTFTKKRVLTFTLALALILTLAACGGGGGGGDTGGAINDAVMTNYAFVPMYMELETVRANVRSISHGDRVYYFYAPWDMPDEDTDMETWEPAPPRIVIASVAADGTDPRQTEIPMPNGSNVNVVGMTVTDEGHYALLYTDTVMGAMGAGFGMMASGIVLVYAVYDADGNELFSQEIEGVVPQDSNWFHVDQALFADGHIILLTQGMGVGGASIYLLDKNRALIGQLEATFPRSLVQTGDGRVFVLDIDNVREVNLEAGTWGESFSISISAAGSLFPAADGDDFDIIIDDGIHLIGYNLTTGEQTLLLNWIESGVATEWGNHVSFLEDGRIAVLTFGWDQPTELIVLTRTPRSELPVREIITLGGFQIPGDVRNQVVAFNRTSQTHQVQVKDYRMYSTNDDVMAGITRFHAELAVGGGSDIVVGNAWSLGRMAESGRLADLYPFLDADPELSRSDFFPNVLRAMEASDGTLPLIANSFSVQTMIGMADSVGHIQSWTLAAMLELIEQTEDEDMRYILGEWLTGDSFLSTVLMFDGGDFIDWSEGRVNLETEAFIYLLEIARRLPERRDLNIGGGATNIRGDAVMVIGGTHITAHERMQRGEQLLDMTTLRRPMDLQMYTATLGDIVALGVPTPDGGAHLIHVNHSFGISAASPNQDEAWNFIRQFLLPGDPGTFIFDWLFPLRMDMYEAIVAEAMREGSGLTMGFGGLMIEIGAMTAEEADILRTIMESADRMGHFDETVMGMVTEELLPFFAGDRSAADTARILQNRLQTYMSERR